VERGCGLPLNVANLLEGETVLDLGCGGGTEAIQAAQYVGPSGFVYGLDMTDEMLAVARKRAAQQHLDNLSFLEGMIEHIPLASHSVDVVISNCVLNLCDDKKAALTDALRVLVVGGRFVIADIVALKPGLPVQMRKDAAMIIGCSNDVLELDDYLRLLDQVGFVDAHINPYRTFSFDYIQQKAAERSYTTLLAELDADLVDNALAAAYVFGNKAQTR
jgi:SAM-dependent methyltransferase